MARTCNGTSDSLQSASAITLGSTQVALSFWLYWDSFGTDDDLAMEYSDNFNNGTTDDVRWIIDPNDSGGNFAVGSKGVNGYDYATFTRPSAAAWHHYAVNFNTNSGSHDIQSIYVDGSSQSITYTATASNTTNFANQVLNLMSRNNASLFGDGRLADVAIWTGINLSGTDVTNLNGGTLPTSVQSGNLVYYWKICGSASPETPTTGAINLTVNGTSQSSHPSAISASCGGGPGAGSLTLTGIAPYWDRGIVTRSMIQGT